MEAPEQPDHSDKEHEARCLCGALVARIVAGGVELKCKRCKRTLIVPLSPAEHDTD